MNQKLRAVLLLFLSLCLILPLAACESLLPGTEPTEPKTGEEVSQSAPVTTLPETEPESTEEPVPEFINPYTGLETTEAQAFRRPVAVMFNNLYEALPQRSVSQCDIVYEVLAEGGILRLCGILTEYENLNDVGSMRSARPYYVELALANDAIFVHAGGTERAYDAIDRFGVNDVDGANRGPFSVNGKQVFWRDQNRVNKGVALEHTLFTSGEMIRAAIEARGYRTELADPEFRAFSFRLKPSALVNGEAATDITVPHSRYSVSKFHFDPDTGLYFHSQYNQPHLDENNNAQVTANNLFILFAPHSLYPGQTTTAYQKIDLVGEGKGWYCWGGERVPITWKRDSQTGTFSYLDAQGNELLVNPGKSYVVIANTAIENSVTFTEN